jgi:hypothetical protein
MSLVPTGGAQSIPREFPPDQNKTTPAAPPLGPKYFCTFVRLPGSITRKDAISVRTMARTLLT